MTENRQALEVTYCERWDPERRATGGPLAPAEARRRHGAGERYCVVLGAPARPHALIEIAGQQDEVTAWCFDAQLRRTFLFEFRMFDFGRMALLRVAEWQYADAEQPEFDASTPRRLTMFGTDGEPVTRSAGPPGRAFREITYEDRWLVVPAFGKWSRLARFVGGEPEPRERHRIVAPAPHEQRSDPPPRRPDPSSRLPAWPPAARRPGPEVTTMFAGPTRYALEPDGSGDAPEVFVEPRPAGLLTMPTGRLVSSDPGWLTADLEPFTVTLPPGRHPVTVAIARFADRPGHVRVAGCRVSVRDEPVTSWEPALVPDQDPGTLDDGEFFAVGVDAGMLCFFDAAMLSGLVELREVWDEPRGLWGDLADAVIREHSADLEDPVTRANLIAFSSGWGDGAYPVWIGRAADGEVVCVVADTLVLSGATVVEA